MTALILLACWLLHRRRQLHSRAAQKKTNSAEPSAHEADSYPVADTKTSHHFKSELESKSVAASGYGRSELEGSLPPASSIAPSSPAPVSPLTAQNNRWSAVSSVHGEGRWLSSMDERAGSGQHRTEIGITELDGSQSRERDRA